MVALWHSRNDQIYIHTGARRGKPVWGKNHIRTKVIFSQMANVNERDCTEYGICVRHFTVMIMDATIAGKYPMG